MCTAVSRDAAGSVGRWGCSCLAPHSTGDGAASGEADHKLLLEGTAAGSLLLTDAQRAALLPARSQREPQDGSRRDLGNGVKFRRSPQLAMRPATPAAAQL